jgi:hypothetical protein
MYMDLLTSTRLEIWINEGRLVDMCSICLVEKSVGRVNIRSLYSSVHSKLIPFFYKYVIQMCNFGKSFYKPSIVSSNTHE